MRINGFLDKLVFILCLTNDAQLKINYFLLRKFIPVTTKLHALQVNMADEFSILIVMTADRK